jgi:type IV fimbrial biogenesis protein FimT
VLEVGDAMMHPMPNRKGQPTGEAGFTLIELMVTVAVLAVMLTLAAPSFVTFQRNSELTTTANSFAAALTAARAEAMKRQLNAFVRPRSGDDWTQGWVVFVDADWDFLGTSSTDIQVSTQGPIPSAIVVNYNGAPSDANSHYLMFNGAGFLRDTNGSFGASRAIELKSGTESRFIIVNPAGRMRVCNPARESNCNSADAL